MALICRANLLPPNNLLMESANPLSEVEIPLPLNVPVIPKPAGCAPASNILP
jgi:hypothetical protein